MNSTETPGGSGIPAGWYDDPSGQGLRWWDGEQWTEHVHSAESAAAATGEAGEGEREAPPPELVKLRESIRAKGAKGVGMVLGGLVLIVVVIALLVSGGSDNSGGAAEPNGTGTGTGTAQAARQKEIKALYQQLKSSNLPKAEKKSLQKELRRLEKEAGGGAKGGKAGKAGKQGKSGKGKAAKKKTPPGEEGK